MKNHATRVVLRVEQQLQHGYCEQNRKNAQELEKQKVEQQLGHGLC